MGIKRVTISIEIPQQSFIILENYRLYVILKYILT